VLFVPRMSASGQPSRRQGEQRTRVLLVDDDEDILGAWEILLQDRYDVAVARNGIEALAVLEREHIDVVVLDVMMPVMDGPAFKRAADERGIRVPIVIVSAAADIARTAERLGVRDYLVKPVDPEALERTIERLAR
jgi:DNA-binding NtrC family response regulator